MALEIKLDDLSGPKIQELLRAHVASLSAISEPCSMHALNLEKLRRPDITFWSIWDGEELVGCGALKELDAQHGEVKSMRTVAAQLRKGAASRLLAHIIAEARRRDYRRLSLETGAAEPFQPAHALYRKFGFTDCSAFGDYKPDPNSLFMTLEL